MINLGREFLKHFKKERLSSSAIAYKILGAPAKHCKPFKKNFLSYFFIIILNCKKYIYNKNNNIYIIKSTCSCRR